MEFIFDKKYGEAVPTIFSIAAAAVVVVVLLVPKRTKRVFTQTILEYLNTWAFWKRKRWSLGRLKAGWVVFEGRLSKAGNIRIGRRSRTSLN